MGTATVTQTRTSTNGRAPAVNGRKPQVFHSGPAVLCPQGLNLDGTTYDTYLLAIPNDRIVERVQFNRRDKRANPDGYQRILNKAHVEDLKHYQLHGLGIIPAVILNARDGKGVSFKNGIITITTEATIFGIDAQHRVTSFLELMAASHHIGNSSLPIMLLCEPREIEDIMFLNQREAREVPQDLYVACLQTRFMNEGIQALRENGGRTPGQKKKSVSFAVAGLIIDSLNNDPRSPLVGQIKEYDDKRTATRIMAKKAMVEGMIYHILSHAHELVPDPKRTAELLIRFLRAARATWPEEFGNRQAYVLQHALGNRALFHLFPTVLHIVERGNQEPTEADMTGVLQIIASKLVPDFWAVGSQSIEQYAQGRGKVGSVQLAEHLAGLI